MLSFRPGPICHKFSTYLFALVCVPVLLIFAGCGSSSVSEHLTTATVTVTALPITIVAGGSSVLQVVATGNTQLTLTGSDGTSYTMSAAGGTQSVKPSLTTTYTASASGVANTATAQVTVTVTPVTVPNPPTVTISAGQSSITQGGTTTLTVAAGNATSVVLAGTDGSSYVLSASGGTQAVTPSATTTFTATATSGAVSVSASTIVTVTPVVTAPTPVLTFAASPPSIPAGGSSTLTAVATNASSVVVTGTDGSSYMLSPSGGKQIITPSATTTYTATASGTGGSASAQTVVTILPAPTVNITASPQTIAIGASSTLTVTSTNATGVVITGSDSTSYTLAGTSGTQIVMPTVTTTYTVNVTGPGGSAKNAAMVTVNSVADISAVQHVIFMLQENHTFDNYFGMLNPYRVANGYNIGDDGVTYKVDGLDDKLAAISNPSDDNQKSYPPFKLTSTCIDDLSSSWLESYGDISRYDFSVTRQLNMDGFVHTAAGYGATCTATNGKSCSGVIKDLSGERAMGYYDEGFLNYYYYMASQFAVSDRWFSPLSSKSTPNRIATLSGGTTQGLAFDPGVDDHLPQLAMPTIFSELASQNVSWKIYYTVTQGACLKATDSDCPQTPTGQFPATDFSYFTDSLIYLNQKVSSTDACTAPLTSSKAAVGDPTDSFCIDLNHIAPISAYFTDLANSTLPSFSFIEAGYGRNDEHPGSGQSVLNGQAQVASIVNGLSGSASWKNSVFFMAYDEGGGPYDHVPPVKGFSNSALTGAPAVDPSLYPDIMGIAVNPDSYFPCLPPTVGTATIHCDLNSANDPGANMTDTTSAGPGQTDAAHSQGFEAQLGFRVPNMIISPFTRKHYVGHNPMDHTAILRFVEDRFLPAGHPYLTYRDAAQPTLLDFFDFTNKPWLTPPTLPASAVAQDNIQTTRALGYDPCTPTVYKKP